MKNIKYQTKRKHDIQNQTKIYSGCTVYRPTQPHCNKDKLINHKYTVQVAVKRKKILPVLFLKIEYFLLYWWQTIFLQGWQDASLIFRNTDQLSGSNQQSFGGNVVPSPNRWADKHYEQLVDAKLATWKRKFLFLQVGVNDVLKHSFEIHVAGLPLCFSLCRAKFNPLENSLGLIKP